LNERKCPPQMKEITTRRAQAMLLHHLPGSFHNFRWNTEQPAEADIFGQTREQLAKPHACVTHHLMPSFVDIFKWCLFCVQQNILHNVHCEIGVRLGQQHDDISLYAPVAVCYHCHWQQQWGQQCSGSSSGRGSGGGRGSGSGSGSGVWVCISKQELTMIFFAVAVADGVEAMGSAPCWDAVGCTSLQRAEEGVVCIVFVVSLSNCLSVGGRFGGGMQWNKLGRGFADTNFNNTDVKMEMNRHESSSICCAGEN
jgi:hypothetical protein